MTTTEISNIEECKQVCIHYHQAVTAVTGVASEISFMTFYDPGYDTQEVAYSPDNKIPEAVISGIENAKSTKIVSERTPPADMSAAEKVSDYFNTDLDSPVLPYERQALILCGYTIEEAYYFAVTIPPKSRQPLGVFFIIVRNEEEKTKIEQKRGDILKVFEKAI
jgi:hypothetical protein